MNSFYRCLHDIVSITIFSLLHFYNHSSYCGFFKIKPGLKTARIRHYLSFFFSNYVKCLKVFAVNILIHAILLYHKYFAPQLKNVVKLVNGKVFKVFYCDFHRDKVKNYCFLRLPLKTNPVQ